MIEDDVKLGDVIHEIGCPSLYVVRGFHDGAAILDVVIRAENHRVPYARWVDMEAVRQDFIRTGHWDFQREMEIDDE